MLSNLQYFFPLITQSPIQHDSRMNILYIFTFTYTYIMYLGFQNFWSCVLSYKAPAFVLHRKRENQMKETAFVTSSNFENNGQPLWGHLTFFSIMKITCIHQLSINKILGLIAIFRAAIISRIINLFKNFLLRINDKEMGFHVIKAVYYPVCNALSSGPILRSWHNIQRGQRNYEFFSHMSL